MLKPLILQLCTKMIAFLKLPLCISLHLSIPSLIFLSSFLPKHYEHSRNLLRKYNMAQIDYRSLLIHRRPPHSTDVAEHWGEMDKSTSICLSDCTAQTADCGETTLLWKSELNNDMFFKSTNWREVYMWWWVYMFLYTSLAVNPKPAYQFPFISPSIRHPTLQYFFQGNCCNSLLRDNYQRERTKSQLIHVHGHLAASLTEFEGYVEGINICPLPYLYGCLLYNEAALKLMVQNKWVYV